MASVRKARQIENFHLVGSGILVEEYRAMGPWEGTKQFSIALEEATEAYMVKVKPNHIFRRCNSLLLGVQLVGCNGKSKEDRQSQSIPTCALRWIWPKWPKDGFRTLQLSGGITSSRNLVPKSEKRRSRLLCFQGIKGESCNRQSPSYRSRNFHRQLPSLPKWQSYESTDTVQAEWRRCTSTPPNIISARNATCATCTTQWKWWSGNVRNRRCAHRICVYTYSTPPHSVC